MTSNSSSDRNPNHYRRQVSAAVSRLKRRLIARYEQLAPGKSGRIRNAVAEAETLAWAMPFPHLFLPAFAEQQLAKVLAPKQLAFARPRHSAFNLNSHGSAGSLNTGN